jgi:hypothetical protein
MKKRVIHVGEQEIVPYGVSNGVYNFDFLHDLTAEGAPVKYASPFTGQA